MLLLFYVMLCYCYVMLLLCYCYVIVMLCYCIIMYCKNDTKRKHIPRDKNA